MQLVFELIAFTVFQLGHLESEFNKGPIAIATVLVVIVPGDHATSIIYISIQYTLKFAVVVILRHCRVACVVPHHHPHCHGG